MAWQRVQVFRLPKKPLMAVSLYRNAFLYRQCLIFQSPLLPHLRHKRRRLQLVGKSVINTWLPGKIIGQIFTYGNALSPARLGVVQRFICLHLQVQFRTTTHRAGPRQ